MMRLNELWPVAGLRVVTPRLQLVVPESDGLACLAELAGRGVYRAGGAVVRAPVAGWVDLPSAEAQKAFLQYYWMAAARLQPASWTLVFGALVDGTWVGVQEIRATDFAVTRAVSTGSWLSPEHQGMGLGKEMRAAVLHLAFEALSAEIADTSASDTNGPSLGVSASMGYVENGRRIFAFRGARAEVVDLRLSRGDFTHHRDDIRVVGASEPALEMLGALAP